MDSVRVINARIADLNCIIIFIIIISSIIIVRIIIRKIIFIIIINSITRIVVHACNINFSKKIINFI